MTIATYASPFVVPLHLSSIHKSFPAHLPSWSGIRSREVGRHFKASSCRSAQLPIFASIYGTTNSTLFPRPNRPIPSNLTETVLEAADASGNALRSFFRRFVHNDFNDEVSLETQAHRLAESVICNVIQNAFPEHVIINMESHFSDHIIPGFAWVIEPLESPHAFVCGRPTFTTHIGVLRDGMPVIGLIDQPISRERWLGIRGEPTTLNGRVVSVQPGLSLSSCIVQTTSPEMFTGIDLLKFQRVSQNAGSVEYGCGGYAYGLLSCGCGEVIMEASKQMWRLLPLVPIIEGAGGIITDWFGRELGLRSDGRIIATASRHVADEIHTILNISNDVPFCYGKRMGIISGINFLVVANSPMCKPNTRGFLQSMTGFGRQVVARDGYTVNVSVKSAPARYCEVDISSSGLPTAFESEMIIAVRKLAVRGKISINVDVRLSGKQSFHRARTTVNEDGVRAVLRLLRMVSGTGVVGKPSISDLLQFSEIFQRGDNGPILRTTLPIVKDAVIVATGDMCSSRQREGLLLEVEIVKRIRMISTMVRRIETLLERRVERKRTRLNESFGSDFSEMLSSRIESESKLFGENFDFSEELARLQKHLQLFEVTVSECEEPVGQRLVILLREVNREVNAIAVEARDVQICHLVVLLKVEIEKVQEQIIGVR